MEFDYKKNNFFLLAEQFSITEENKESAYNAGIGRFALLLEDKKENYWIDTFDTEDELLTSAEQTFQEPGYKPIFLVDLLDYAAREISCEVRIQLSDVLEEAA